MYQKVLELNDKVQQLKGIESELSEIKKSLRLLWESGKKREICRLWGQRRALTRKRQSLIDDIQSIKRIYFPSRDALHEFRKQARQALVGG